MAAHRFSRDAIESLNRSRGTTMIETGKAGTCGDELHRDFEQMVGDYISANHADGRDSGVFSILCSEVAHSTYGDTLSRPHRLLRVCIVSPCAAGPYGNDEGDRFAVNLALTLSADGHDVTLLLSGPEEGIGRQYQLRRHNVAVAQLPTIETGKVDGTPAQHLAYETYVWLKNEQFDLVHCAESAGLGYYCLLAKHQRLCFENTLFCLNIQGPSLWAKSGAGRHPEGLEDLAVDFMERESVALADVAICPSQFMIDWLLSNNWRLPKMTFIRQNPLVPPLLPGGPSEQHGAASPSEGHQEKSVQGIAEIVFLGSLERRSGLPLFCDVVDRLSPVLRSPVKITFLVLGFQSNEQQRLMYL